MIPGGLELEGKRPEDPMRSSNPLGEWSVGRTEESPYGSVVTRVVKKTVIFISCFFQEKKHVFFVFFSFFSGFFLASDVFIFKDLTYGYRKLMMLFKTQTFLLD